MPHDDFEVDAMPGLPEAPPEGEQILWQGRPNWFRLARESLWLYPVGGYFLFLALWRFGSVVDLMPIGQALGAAVPNIVLGLVVCGLLMLTAWAQARCTIYTLTTARVVMRIGAALTMTINLPYREVGSADLSLRPDGTGTIAFKTLGKTRLSYLVLWPHVRPWRMNPSQPALRCIPDAKQVADLIAQAAEAKVSEPRVARMPEAVAAE